MSKSWYKIQGRSNGARETHISIMEQIGGFGVTAKQFRDDIQHLGETEPLHVHINSDGGDIIEGNEIYNTLAAHKGPVRVSIGALAASMASVIAMAGDEISIAENAMLMIHNPWTIAMGDAEEMKKVAGVLDDLKSGIVNAYRKQTNLAPDEISALMSEESWFTAEEALDLGFVDTITAPADKGDTAQAVNFNVNRFHNSISINQWRNSMKSTKEKLLNNDPAPPEPGDDPIAAERNRISEIQAIADAVLKRDKKDFSNEAKKAIAEGMSAEEFSKALITSERYKLQQTIGNPALPDEIGSIGGLGAAVVHSEAYRALKARGSLSRGQVVSVDVPRSILSFRPRNATPVTSTALTSIQFVGPEGYLALQPARVADLIAQFPTGAATVRFIAETSFTNAAAAVGQGAAKPEQVWNLVEKDAPVRKIAVWSKISDEVLQDQSRLAAFINQKLQASVMLTLDQEVLNGDGTGAHITGILATSGIQTQAKGTDANLDAIHKALTKVRSVSFFEPDAIILNPTDWQLLRLAKDTTNGQYFGGGPFYAPYGGGPYEIQPSLWGKQAVITTAIAAGTALVGSFALGAELYMRQGLTIDMTNSDQDDFIKNLDTIRVELRAGLGVTHPLAFCSVTGIT